MICQECGQARPLTYRSAALQLRSVCGPCIRVHHPGTLEMPGGASTVPKEYIWQPHENAGAVRYVNDGDSGAGGDAR